MGKGYTIIQEKLFLGLKWPFKRKNHIHSEDHNKNATWGVDEGGNQGRKESSGSKFMIVVTETTDPVEFANIALKHVEYEK